MRQQEHDWRQEARQEFGKVWSDPIIAIAFLPITLFITGFLAFVWVVCWVSEKVGL